MAKNRGAAIVAKVSNVVSDDKFTIKKSQVLASHSDGIYRTELGMHEFKLDGTSFIQHYTDGQLRATVELKDWPDYVLTNSAAARACEK